MIEVRLFAGLRQGREKITLLDAAAVTTVADIMACLNIAPEEVNILLINGFHQKPDSPVQEGDVVSLFPAVGGG